VELIISSNETSGFCTDKRRINKDKYTVSVHPHVISETTGDI
jgi:hypothetical protein